LQVHQGIRGKRIGQVPLDIRDLNTGMADQRLARSDPPVDIHGVIGLQWVPWADQPPHPIQTYAPQRTARDMHMTHMRGIEGSTQQPDALAWKCK